MNLISVISLISTLFAIQVASAQIPAEKAFPPASLFGVEYGKEGVDPFTLEYLNGKKVEFEEHVVTITTYFENESDNFFSVSFHKDKKTVEEKFNKAHAEFRAKRKDLTSDIQKDKHGKFFTLRLDEAARGGGKAMVSHMALIHNVFFKVTGYAKDKKFQKWIKDYSEYLSKSYVKETISYKDWEGANGNIVKGHVHSVSPEKETITFETEDGKIYHNVSLAKFSEKSRKEILASK